MLSLTALLLSACAAPQTPFLPATPDWQTTGALPWEYVGRDVADAGDVNGDGFRDLIVVAAGAPSSPGVHGTGRADLYYGSANGWSTTPDWTVRGGLLHGKQIDRKARCAGDLNGDGVDDLVLSGSNNTSADYRGGVYVFYGSPAGPHGGVDAIGDQADWIALGEQSLYNGLGSDVVGVGDVNGDGFDDLLAGAEGHTILGGPSPREGAVCLWYGSANGLGPIGAIEGGGGADWIVTSGASFAALGKRVHALGDVNDGGFADFAITADTGPNLPPLLHRRHWIFLGGPNGPAAGLAGAWDTIGGSDFGFYMSYDLAVGDFDQDGWRDLVIPYPSQFFPGHLNPVFLYRGTPNGFQLSPWGTPHDFNHQLVGESLEAGDIDGDGVDDLAIVVGVTVNSPAGNTGKVRVYRGRGAGYVEPLDSLPTWEWSFPSLNSGPVARVALLGSDELGYPRTLAVGEPDGDANGVHRCGRASLFGRELPLLETCPTAKPDWQLVGVPDENLGRSATLADFNGDGFDDALVVRRPRNVNDPHLELYLGGASGLASTRAWSYRFTESFAHHGVVVCEAGDVNGDQRADALVLLRGNSYWPGATLSGRGAYVFHGTAGGLATQPSFSAHPTSTAPTQFAWAGAIVGDLNADGFDDVAIGAPGWEQLPAYYIDPYDIPGAVYVWYGSANGVNGGVNGDESNADWVATHTSSTSYLGDRIRRAGDVDGDGVDDLVVSAPFLTVGSQPNHGAIYVWRGSTNGPNSGAPGSPTSRFQELVGPPNSHAFGLHFSAGVDLTGDGRTDLLTRAPGSTVGDGFELRAASAAGFETLSSCPLQRTDRYGFGAGFAAIPDFDGDGKGDVVSITPAATGTKPQDGRLDIFRGRATAGANAVSPAAVWRAAGDQAFGGLGSALLLAHGDVNGDGLADILTGAPPFDASGGNEGRFVAYYGTLQTLLEVTPTSVLAGGTLRFAHLGWRENVAMGVVAFRPSNPTALVLLGRGTTDADGCWIGDLPLHPAMTPGVWNVQSIAIEPGFGRRYSEIRAVTVQ